jgi:multidrug transporter EmrE-like cation transporter
LSTTLTTPEKPAHKPFSRRTSLVLVFACTLLGAFAQILFKTGLASVDQFTPLILIANLRVFSGMCLYGSSTVLLVLALRDGELSLLYPVISLTYAWVTVLSLLWLGETMNVYKALGILTIVLGVALLGRGARN